MNSLLLDALYSKNKGRPPVWIMRQAGRYMPSYRQLRQKHSFVEMCTRPELIAQVTMMPIEQLNVDAAILFSDILLPLLALGCKITYEESLGPQIEKPCAIESLKSLPVEETLHTVPLAIKELVSKLQVPLLGFAGAPFTLASYLIEGKTSKDLKLTKKFMLENPEGFKKLLDLLAQLSADFLNMQIKAGVQAVQLFDTWAQALSPMHFKEYSLCYMDKVRALLPSGFPVIYFCRGSAQYAHEMCQSKPTALSIDWNAELPDIRRTVGHGIALQGNLDPAWLYAPPQELKKAVKMLLKSMQGDKGYIFNLGHGVFPDVPYDNVRLLVDTVLES